ncbi:MAG: hypothetical protein AAGD09_23890 [Cyanobacteria bacterium P01_F01_bin.56]
METRDFAILKADMAAQMQTISRVFDMLEARAEGLTADSPEQLESAAYQLHNFYGAIEELLRIVAAHFENTISDTARWHSLLLQRMTQSIQDVRPAVLSLKSYTLLNALRSFRHFFRHAYGIPIDWAQLQSNLAKARQLKPLLDQDLSTFLQTLNGLSD